MITEIATLPNGTKFLYSCQATVIGRNPENADMSNPNGDIYGRQYTLCVNKDDTFYYYRHHVGFRDSALVRVFEDAIFFMEIDNFDPALCEEFTKEERIQSWED